MEKEKIVELWKDVFPNSSMFIRNALVGGNGFSCCGRLSNGKNEVSNGILENDPLTFYFLIENNNYYEYRAYIHIKPNNKYMVYSTVNLRKKNIKNVTEEKLKARFNQVKQLVIDNKDNFINLHFNINDKI